MPDPTATNMAEDVNKTVLRAKWIMMKEEQLVA